MGDDRQGGGGDERVRRHCVYCRAVHGEFADDEERVYKLAWRLADVHQGCE